MFKKRFLHDSSGILEVRDRRWRRVLVIRLLQSSFPSPSRISHLRIFSLWGPSRRLLKQRSLLHGSLGYFNDLVQVIHFHQWNFTLSKVPVYLLKLWLLCFSKYLFSFVGFQNMPSHCPPFHIKGSARYPLVFPKRIQFAEYLCKFITNFISKNWLTDPERAPFCLFCCKIAFNSISLGRKDVLDWVLNFDDTLLPYHEIGTVLLCYWWWKKVNCIECLAEYSLISF